MLNIIQGIIYTFPAVLSWRKTYLQTLHVGGK